MDEAEKALIAEANAAGVPSQPPPGEEPEETVPPASGDAVMEIEDDEEPMKIVRDYKRPDQRQDPALLNLLSQACLMKDLPDHGYLSRSASSDHFCLRL